MPCRDFQRLCDIVALVADEVRHSELCRLDEDRAARAEHWKGVLDELFELGGGDEDGDGLDAGQEGGVQQ